MGCIGSNRCPRKLNSFPSSPCQLALDEIAGLRRGQEGKGCPWYVNDIGSNYCVFKYLADNNGTPTSDAKTAQLLLVSDATVKKIVANFRRRTSTAKALDD